jgi:polysaccharide pyruvyl transferase WcaK-like protein
MIIEIKGVEFENKGSHLMLVAIVRKIRSVWPTAEFALTHSDKASYAQRQNVANFRKVNLRKNYIDINWISYFLPSALRSFLKWCGLVTEADVDMIIDASGFSYSDQWPSKVRIYHLNNELERFHLYVKPYIFLPQAFGPFSHIASRERIKKSFKYAALICAREQESLINIQEITGPLESLVQYNDFTNLADGIVPKLFDHNKSWACIVPNNNMLNVRNVNKTWLDKYEIILVEAISYYRKKGLTPFFLNHEGEKDGALIDYINRIVDEPVPIVMELDPLLVKGVIGASRAVLSSRYHGCISALSQGISCIGTSWSHKYELLYHQYDATELLLDPNTNVEELQRSIDISLEEDSHIAKLIACKSLELRANSVDMWCHFQTVVERYPAFQGLR